MTQMLVVTGVDAREAALGLDVTRMFHEMGLSKDRQVEFHAVQDNKDVPIDWISRRLVNKAYLEVDRVLAATKPRVMVDVHHADRQWPCFEVQIPSGLCSESTSFQSWAKSITNARIRAGAMDVEDQPIYCYQLPTVRDRLWADLDPINMEVIPSLAPLRERLKIDEAPLQHFDFPGSGIYEQEIRIVARTLAAIYDHHPWLNRA